MNLSGLRSELGMIASGAAICFDSCGDYLRISEHGPAKWDAMHQNDSSKNEKSTKAMNNLIAVCAYCSSRISKQKQSNEAA